MRTRYHKLSNMLPKAVLKYLYYEERDVVLLCGDCLEILPLFQENSIDLVLTDPPYGVGYTYESHKDKPIEYKMFIEPRIKEMLRFGNALICTSIRQMKMYPQPKWVLCWHKPGSVRRNDTGGFNIWEPIFFYGKRKWNLDAITISSIANISRDAAKDHPCPKPLKLFKWLVDKGSDNGNLILDPFLGSGTTAVAAKQLGRKCIGIEIEPKYLDIAIKRLKNEDRLLINGDLNRKPPPPTGFNLA